MNARIDWHYPEPREGLAGAWDQFIGPGATRAEVLLQLAAAVAAPLALLIYARAVGIGWSPVQTIVALLLAFDLAGGVVTNATSSAKRWYHRAGQGFWQHLLFIAVHVHPFVVAWLFRDGDWVFAVVLYGYLLAAAVIVLRVPLYLQRPTALILFCGALLLNSYVFPPTPGLEWFVPLFYLKLLVSHLLREEPYRPAGGSSP